MLSSSPARANMERLGAPTNDEAGICRIFMRAQTDSLLKPLDLLE